MDKCDVVAKMTLHRNYDRRCTQLRSQFNQFMETSVISAESHAIIRPLVLGMQNIVADALEAQADCLSPEQLHRAYDDRCQQFLDQENELQENQTIDGKTHGLCRNILLGFEMVVKDALVARFGSDSA